MAQKKKVEISEFEKDLLACAITVRDSVNGKSASMRFRNRNYSSTAPSDMPKRQQKSVAIKNLLNLVRSAWGQTES